MGQSTKNFNPNFYLSVTTAGSSSLESVKNAPLISWLPCSYNFFCKLRFISRPSFHMYPQISRQNKFQVTLFANLRFRSSASSNYSPKLMQSRIVCKITIYLFSNVPCCCCRLDHCQKWRLQAHREFSYLNIPR